jgi:uroporphyrin-3 C-methyltransferase/uroporphyrinogen III methyltransferase/synthase
MNDISAPKVAHAPADNVAPPPSAPADASDAPRARRGWRFTLALVLLVVVIAAVLAMYADLARRHETLRGEIQQRLTLATQDLERTQRLARAAEERVDGLVHELDQLRAQRSGLDQLYQELSRGRDEAALFDVERLIVAASLELRLSGHVPTALNALAAADARLARLERPQYVALRRALARDIERLRAVPVVDVTGMAVKLDQLGQSIDELPMLADPAVKPAAAPVQPKRAAGADGKAKADAKGDGKQAAKASDEEPPSLWARARTWMASEFGDLVRIREVDAPEALLLSTAQQQLVRSQFRTRLLDARLALLSRQERVFRADLAEAQNLLARYFDGKNQNVAATLLQLKQLAQSPLAVDLPPLDESLTAIRNARPAAPLPAAK